MKTIETVQLILVVGLIGGVIYLLNKSGILSGLNTLADQTAQIPGALSDIAAYVASGGNPNKLTVEGQQAWNSVVIPGTGGQTVADLKAIGYTDDQLAQLYHQGSIQICGQNQCGAFIN
jgi:hypothetical protein